MLKIYIRRLINNEPRQYIFGKVSVYGIYLKVNKHVMIPHLETVLLVENVLTDSK